MYLSSKLGKVHVSFPTDLDSTMTIILASPALVLQDEVVIRYRRPECKWPSSLSSRDFPKAVLAQASVKSIARVPVLKAVVLRSSIIDRASMSENQSKDRSEHLALEVNSRRLKVSCLRLRRRCCFLWTVGESSSTQLVCSYIKIISWIRAFVS